MAFLIQDCGDLSLRKAGGVLFSLGTLIAYVLLLLKGINGFIHVAEPDPTSRD